jgi:tight adherence protein C
MIWALTAIAFLATMAICMTLVWTFLPVGRPVGERLARLRRPATAPQDVTFREKQQARVERVLTDVGKLLPSSSKGLSRTHRMMIRAGYRRPEIVHAMQGIKVLLPIGLVSLVYFTGFYRLNPLFILVAAALVGFILPELWLTSRVRRRQHRIVIALPDGLDLLVVCVEAGLGLDQAISRVAEELRLPHPELSDELQLVNLEVRVGKSRLEALRELGVRTGVEDLKSLTAMLIQTDRFGTDLARSLRVHSENLRTKRRQRAEEMAAKTTVKMIPPLVFFIFPALFAVLLGPAVISLVRQLLPALK